MSRLAAVAAWFGTGHERRAKLLAVVGVVLILVTIAGTLAPSPDPELTTDDQRPQGNTLVALQGYHDEGRVVELNPAGEVVWQYDDPDDVFDVEVLGPDRIQLSTAEEIPDAECPEQYRDDGFPNCVRNSLRIVEKSSKETLWEYWWYDVELHEHELHDADYYEQGGEDGEASEDRWVLADMGNDRVFAVNREKEIVWEWNATDDYDRPAGMGPEDDWTHLNDVDRLEPGVFVSDHGERTNGSSDRRSDGVFQVSLRNFDTVISLHVADDGSTSVEPVVGPNDFETRGEVLHEQHNPDRLADGHLLVADSERDRVVELDTESSEVVWEWGGSENLQWPRDADRLPNGHTLVTDSYGERVLEIDEEGNVVWAVQTGGLPYEADRVPANWTTDRAEGSAERPTAPEVGLPDRVGDANPIVERLDWATAMAKYVLPPGVVTRLPLLVGGVLAILGAGIEGVRARGGRQEGWEQSEPNAEADD